MKNEQKTITNANEVRQSKPNVPTLRFKQYDDKWTICNLSDIASVVGGGTPDTTDPLLWNGNVQWFTPTEVGHSKYVSKSVRTISRLGLQKSSAKVLPKGSILLSSRATVGECSIVKNECTTNQGFQSLIPRKGINNEFLYYLTRTKKKHFIKYASGSTFLEISNSEIKKTKCAVPCIDEQAKIAEFLSLLDEKIETQNKIISKYESLIKGIYTQLQTNTQKQEHCLSNIVKYNSVGLLSKEDLIENGAKKCILYGELFTTYDEVIGEIHSKTNVDGYISKGNEILFPSSTTVDAMSLIAPSALNEQGVLLGGDMFVLEMKSGFNNEYVSYYLNIIAKRTFAKYAQGTTITHLYFEHIKNLPLYLPNITIQTSIASIMKKIKKKIEIEKEMLSALQRQKAFLLKTMFI